MKSIGRARGALCAFSLLAFQVGCSESVQVGAKSADGSPQRRDTRVVHEDCALGSAEKLDANADGKPDVWIVRSGGKEVCRAVDLNFDGKVDGYSYFDASGQLRRRERDYDRDGQIEEIQIFQGGVLVEKHRATVMAGRLDTWQIYQAGKLARTERDSDGDAIVDQWWEFKADTDKCPMVHSDIDGDGRPDPGATIDYCKQTGYVPPSRAAASGPKHTFERPGALPEETENKEAPAGDAPKKEEKK